jgi:hypothetical protein
MPIRPAFPSVPRTAGRALLAGLALLAALCLAPRAAAAQDPAPPDTARRPLQVAGDSARARRDTIPGDSTWRITPQGAFLRSLVIPGWGQSELGLPGRGGIYFSLEAGSLWMFFKSAGKLREARELETIARETGEIGPDDKHPLVRDRENQREDWLTLSIFWLFFSGADAFVSAHLQDFDVHVNAVPRPGGALEVQATVPLGGP